MEIGFVRLPRCLFNSPSWKTPRHFSMFEAYLDLLRLASWRSFQYYLKGRLIALEPGDLVTTSSQLAARWDWTRDEVRRWLKHLVNYRVLTAEVVEGRLKISLDAYCNSRFTQSADPGFSAETQASRARKDTLSSSPSSSKEKEENTSSVLTSSEHRVREEEGRTEEENVKTSSEEKKTDETSPHPEALPARAVDEIADALAERVSWHERHRATPGLQPPPQTSFPPAFPLAEFRSYVQTALLLPPGERPKIHRNWVAEMRDKFLAECAAREKEATESSPPQETKAA